MHEISGINHSYERHDPTPATILISILKYDTTRWFGIRFSKLVWGFRRHFILCDFASTSVNQHFLEKQTFFFNISIIAFSV